MEGKVKVPERPQRNMPLYYEVSNRLIETIKKNGLQAGDQMPTTAVLADSLKVNYRTVKSAFEVLRGKGIIRQESNRRAVVVKPLLRRKHKFLFVRWDGSSLWMAIMDGIKRFAEERKIEYSVIDVKQSHERFINAIIHPGKGIDGLIVLPFEDMTYRKAVKETLESGVKVVLVDRIIDGVEVSSVTVDNFAGGYLAARHLLETHGCPVYYIGTKQPSSCLERIAGWREAMNDHHFVDFEKYIYEILGSDLSLVNSRDYAIEECCEAARRLFRERQEDKYCIFTCNDYVARGVYLVAEEFKLQIGRDIFVVGFGDFPLCGRMPMPLSSVTQSSESVGYEAAKLLYRDIEGEVKYPIHRVLPVELRIRESSIGTKCDVDKRSTMEE
jgi:DNA-binding LacI/PurR family transcriptional regulator